MEKEQKPTTEKVRAKKYRCSRCGHVTEQTTNHYGETYSVGRFHACPVCPPFTRPTRWICCEPCPPHMNKPEPWTLPQ